MSFVAVVTDSTASIDKAYASEHHLTVVPLYIKVGDKMYRDGVDIQPDEFYELLPKCEVLPTTSQPSAGDFVEVYQKLVDQGAEGIISIHLSSGLSGTVNSANLATEQVNSVPIEIIDTQVAVGGHLLTVEGVVQALEVGKSFAEAVQIGRAIAEAQQTCFVVDTLEYLYKGGRIGGAAALVGSLLQFKPLLNFKEGRIDALGRVRTFNRALSRLVEEMIGWVSAEEPVRAIVMQAACMDRAEALAEHLPKQLNITDVRIVPLSPAIGTHAGNGTIGLCCCPAKLFPK